MVEMALFGEEDKFDISNRMFVGDGGGGGGRAV
jgi:hypothetical protein